MRIEQKIVDNELNMVNGLPVGFYYYYFPQSKLFELSQIISNDNAITSVFFAPFFPKSDNTVLYEVPYNNTRVGADFSPRIYRVEQIDAEQQEITSVEDLGVHPKYFINPTRDYNNESRLLYEPYSTILVCDYINAPWEVDTSFLIDFEGNKKTLVSKFMLSDGGYYKLYFNSSYKNDFGGLYECLENTSNLEIPCSSTAYANWSSTQKASSNQNFLNNLNSLANATKNNNENIDFNKTKNAINTGMGVGGSVASMLGGNIFGGAMGLINTGVNSYLNNESLNLQGSQNNRNFDVQQKAILGSKSAIQKDLNNTPRTMINTSDDILGGIGTGKSITCKLVNYTITEDYKKRLGDYFAMYGYKQSKVMPIDLRSRRDYNYVKTVGANITNTPNGSIPKDHLNKLSDIFNEGVTCWHLERNGGIFQNYTKDNTEVNLL